MGQLFVGYAGAPAGYLGQWFSSHNGTDSAAGGSIAYSHIAGAHYIQSPGHLRGYYFKILTKQGESAPGGAYDYIVDGRMITGFGLVASPAANRVVICWPGFSSAASRTIRPSAVRRVRL